MKNSISKFLSALLALVTVVGSFTGVISSPVSAVYSYAAETGEPENATTSVDSLIVASLPGRASFDFSKAVTKEEWMKAFEAVKYVSEYDKLSTMGKNEAQRDENGALVFEPWLEKDGYQIYASTLSGEVAVKNTATGQVIFSNPYDVTNRVKSSVLYRNMLSQIILEYSDIKSGGKQLFNSYAEAASRKQISISYIRNGISVEYTIGQQSERRLLPYVMEKYRFEKLLLNKITDPSVKKRFLGIYNGKPVEMNIEEERENNLTAGFDKLFPVLTKYDDEDHIFVSDDYAEYAENPDAWEGTAIPYQGYMSIYNLGGIEGQTTEAEKNWIEKQIREYAPEYTYDDLAYDHELTEFESKAEKMPVFRMALEYRIDEDGFTVRLPASSILFDESNYRLNYIKVLPYMGAGHNEYTGYLVIPDGSGSLVRFEDYRSKEVVFNTGTLYGLDNAYHTPPSTYRGQTEKMRFPIFGIVTNTEKNYTVNEQGVASEICPHRWLKGKLEPDCAYKDPETGAIVGRDGYEYEYCDICGQILEEKTVVIPYEHREKAYSAKNVIAATCCTYAVNECVCYDCGRKYLVNVVSGGLKSHTYGSDDEGMIYDTENHTCTEMYWCTNSVPKLDEKGNVIPILKENGEFDYSGGKLKVEMTTCHDVKDTFTGDDVHEYEETIIVDAENHVCTLKKECKNCGNVELHVLDESEHAYTVTFSGDVNGVCTKIEICENCGYCRTTKGLHDHGKQTAELSVDKEAHRCYYEYTCEVCKETYTEDVTEHDLEDGVCKNCGYAIPVVEGHTLAVGYVTVDGECYRTFICTDDCGYELESARVKVSHSYVENPATKATCTECGYIVYSCENCGKEAYVEYLTEELPAKGHKYVHVEENHNDCENPYTSYDQCSVCKEKINIVEHEGGHTYKNHTTVVSGGDETCYRYECTKCGHVHFEVISEHTEESVEPEESTGEIPSEEEGESEEEAASEADVSEEPASEEPASEEPSGSNSESGEEEPELPEGTQTTIVSNGFLAVITSGSGMATLEAGYGGSVNGYNYIYMIVTPRPSDSYNLKDAMTVGADRMWTVVSERKYTGSYTLKYFMLQTTANDTPKTMGYSSTKFDATYSGMAAAYRDYLCKTGVLEPLEKNDKGIPLYLEAFGAINVSSSFLTFPTTKKVALTTFDDLKEITNELKSENIGISNIQFKLNGFTNGGVIATMPYKVDFVGAVGGNSGFRDFVSFAQKNNVGVYPDFDFANMDDSGWFDGVDYSKHLVKTIDGRYIMKKDYYAPAQMFMTVGTGYSVISASVYDYFYETFNKNYSEFGNKGIAASTLGTDLNSDFDEDDPYNREDSREFTEKILEQMKSDYGSVMLDGGNAYSVKYADHILNMSLSGSKHLTTSCSIPFVSMVLHGYVNYAGTPTNMASSMDVELLHIIENGASPYFIIATQNTRYVKGHALSQQYYSLDYSTWKEDIVASYKELNDLLKDVQYANYISHEYVTAARLPDRSEAEDDYTEGRNAIISAIEAVNAAQTRVENAEALYNRKAVEEPNLYRKEIIALINEYENGGESMTAEELAAMMDQIAVLKAKIDECLTFSKKGGQMHSNISASKRAYTAALKVFETAYNRYSYLFEIPEGKDAMDISVYKEKGNCIYFEKEVDENGDVSYKFVEDIDIAFAPFKAVDANGNVIKSNYSITNSSVAKVGYDNGVEFYLNYNYFDVVLKIDGETVLIAAYSCYKHTV